MEINARQQVIVIKLDGFFYGINVAMVQEVLNHHIDRPLPDTPNFIEGLIYVRDKLVPVLRLKRLFNNHYFDLYSNKKILVLDFLRDTSLKIDTSFIGIADNSGQIGIIVDEVIGIEYYSEEEVKPVSSIYEKGLSQEIKGFIERDKKRVGLVDIQLVLFTQSGEFRYQAYSSLKHQEISTAISKDDFLFLEEHTKKINFPLNEVTAKPLVSYLDKIAKLSQKSIREMVEKNPEVISENQHFNLDSSEKILFKNAPDMYMMTEYLSILDKKEEIKVLVVDSGDGLNVASFGLIADILKKNLGACTFYNEGYDIDNLKSQEDQFLFSEKELERITKELQTTLFDVKETSLNTINATKEYEYRLKPRIVNRIKINPIDLEKYLADGESFNLIYAPNFLIRDMDNIHKNIEIFEKILVKKGILVLGLFENIEVFFKRLKKYYIKTRLVFIKE